VVWTTPGGDFTPILSAALTVQGAATYTWADAGLAADVQRWVSNPATNFGWIIFDADPVNVESAQRFGSRENADPTVRPLLTITYAATTVPATSTWSNLLIATTLVLIGVALMRRTNGLRAHARG
jgi:hypothetical protein